MKELQLELTTNCDSDCVMCPRRRLKRGLGTMGEEFAKKVIDDAHGLGARLIKAQWFGETLSVPYWHRVVRHARRKGMKTILITNGSLLNKRNRKYVLKYVDKIFISIDSSDKKTYESIRRGLKFSIVIGNLRALFGERGMGRKTTIIASRVALEGNRDDNLDALRGFCDEIVSNPDNVNVECKERKEVVCRHNVDERLVVGWDGKCYLCCHDWLGEHEIGDLKKQSMKQIWEGEKRKKYLNNLNSLDICQRCMQS